MRTYKLSVITPVFNSIQFIEKCILNVVSQDCPDVEHLIMDAGSTDGTLEVIEKYAEKYSHIRFFSEGDKGQSDAMNKGMKLAKASLVSFLNADDGYFAFTLNRVLDIMDNKPSLDFITGNLKVYDIKGKLIYINRPKRIRPYHLFSYTETFPINPSAYFYKKSIHDVIGDYTVENHHNMDYEFILKAGLHCNLVYFNEDWGYAVHHDNAKTVISLANDSMFEKKLQMFRQVYATAPFKVKLMAHLYKIFKKFR
jgi:glycosyltransferase involved in cell wall biosynthesis